jgi:hypothetical protein
MVKNNNTSSLNFAEDEDGLFCHGHYVEMI